MVERRVVVTMLHHAVTDPKIRDELRERGYIDQQMPNWVAAEKK